MNGRRDSGQRRWALRFALALAGFLALGFPVDAEDPDRIVASATSAGDAAQIDFNWASPVDATAKVERRTLSVSFARPFELDLAKLADAVAPFGRFVRLSADRKTLSIVLTRDLVPAAERTPTGWMVRLTSGEALPPAIGEPEAAPAETHAETPHDANAGVPKADAAKAEKAQREEPAPAQASKSEAGAGKPAAHDTPSAAHDEPDVTPAQSQTVPRNAPGQPALTVSEAADYTRLAFEWPKPVEYSAELAEGELKIAFKSKEEVRLADLRVHPPKRVRDASGSFAGDQFIVQVKVEPGVSLRHAKDENYVIVDLVGPKEDEHKAPGGTDEAHGAPAGETAAIAVPPAVPMLIAASALRKDAPGTTGVGAHESAAVAHSPAAPVTNIAPDTIKSVMKFGDIDVSVLEERLKNSSHDEPAPKAPAGDALAPAAGDPEPLSVAVPPSTSFAMTVALESRVIKLGFPWGEAVPAAVLRRGDRLWIAFAREAEIDLSAVERVRGEGVLGAQLIPAKGGTLVSLKLADSLLATAIPVAGGWTVALGDSILAPTADIPLERRLEERDAELAAKLAGETAKLEFTDPGVNDDLVFVMAGGPARGFVSPRRFVDFDLLATMQGLVVRPIADDVEVRLETGAAVIGRRGGLHVAGTHLVSASRAAATMDPHDSPAEMKFAEWRGPAKVPFTQAYQQALTRLSKAEDADRTETQIDLARFLMGHGLNEEAIGVLDLAVDEAPQLVNQPQLRALRGVANLLAGRPGAAEKDLDLEELPDDPSTVLWLGLLASAKQDFPRARSYLARAEPAIVHLDNEWQAKVRLKAAEAGLEINDFGWARSAIELMPTENLKRSESDEAKLLRARLAEAMGDPKAAAAAYEALSHSPIEPVAVKARLAAVLQEVRAGKLSTNDAIDKLEALRFEWRGDAIEAQTLLALGQLYAKLGDFRHALSTMRIVVRQFPGTPNERRVYSEMADLFEDLFLDGKADEMPPIQALALYFDFKELTPIGPKGDVMIRRLSDRLVAMDLLDQAGELLKHQVDNRLSGVARSQVAARLALVQLMNHKPEDALLTINKTRQARLPDDISLQRRLIEARALMDLKRYEHALDIVGADVGPTVDRLRADIYWHAENWAKAGPALEAGLGQAAAAPLTEAQRFDAMRAAIAYALGNDRAGLARIKTAYAAKMKDTPDAHGFDVVTSEPGQGSVELYSLAERFAGIDTLADFLGQLKEKDVVENVN